MYPKRKPPEGGFSISDPMIVALYYRPQAIITSRRCMQVPYPPLAPQERAHS
jgi:hypothetical protein